MVGSLDRWIGKLAVVTGASAGIGAAIVEKLSKSGVNIVGFARRKEKIDELAQKLKSNPGKIYSVKVDMTQENEILKAFKWIKNNNLGPVHILINNAGVIKPTSLIDGDSELWRKVLDTNVFGLCVATREAIKDMRANNVDGHIIHINSVLGHWVLNFPRLNVYPASKFAVTALSQTLRYELMAAGTKIKVTSISPGLVETEIFDANKFDAFDISKFNTLKAEDVADSVVYVLGTPPHVQIQELTIRPVAEQY